MAQVPVKLSKFDNQPWGFRIQGGKDFSTPITVQKVNGGSLAEKAGLNAGDTIVSINGIDALKLRHKEAQDTIVKAGNNFEIVVIRGNVWKPAVTPLSEPKPQQNGETLLTKTSLAANQQAPRHVGSAHNVQATPFGKKAPVVNGTPAQALPLSKQYNSPAALYSEESIAETLTAQAEVLSQGVLGVNFKKNERQYDPAQSEVLKMIQEADSLEKSRDPGTPCESVESVRKGSQTSRIQSHAFRRLQNALMVDEQEPPVHAMSSRPVGTRPVEPPKTKPKSDEPSVNVQDLTKCGDCDRVIVGIFVKIKGRNLHVECFKCATCGTSLKNIGYYDIGGKLYCDMHARQAAKHNPPVESNERTAPDKASSPVPPAGLEKIRPRAQAAAQLQAAAAAAPAPAPAPAPVPVPEPAPVPVPSPVPPVIKAPAFNPVAAKQDRPISGDYHMFAPRPASPCPGQNGRPKPVPSPTATEDRFSPAAKSEHVRSSSPNVIYPRPFEKRSLDGIGFKPQPTPPSTPEDRLSPANHGIESAVHYIQNVTYPKPFEKKSVDVPSVVLEDRLSPASQGMEQASPSKLIVGIRLFEKKPVDDEKACPSKAAGAQPLKAPGSATEPSSGDSRKSSSVGSREPSVSPHTNLQGEEHEPWHDILTMKTKSPSDRPECHSCKQKIARGPFVTALGRNWCPEHFVCANESCKRHLQDIGFVEEKNELYCESCFENFLAPVCDKCQKRVIGDCLKAIGKQFHPECFACAYCGRLFGNSRFYLEDGLPYCEADWNELFTTKCFGCGFPIEAGDRWVEAMNNNYHSQCFNCSVCKKNLEGQSFLAKGGKPMCKSHAARM